MNRMNNKNGFTLAEVAFSIAIIGLAVVVSMAVFAAGIKAHSQTSLRMVAAATATYLMDVGLGRDFAKSDSRPGPSILASIPTVIALPPTGWNGQNINWATEITLEDPYGGPEKVPNLIDEFVLKFPDFGNPAANLIFKVSPTEPQKNIHWRKLSIWGCDWRNKPSGISMRAPLLVEFMYYDYDAP